MITTSTPLDNLYQAIVQDPTSLDLRMVYADCLDDHGQYQRADLIRVQMALSKLGPKPLLLHDVYVIGRGEGYLEAELSWSHPDGLRVGTRIDINAHNSRGRIKKLYGMVITKILGYNDYDYRLALKRDKDSRPWKGKKLQAREKELISPILKSTFSNEQMAYIGNPTWQNGFPDHISIDEVKWLRYGPLIVRATPVVSVMLAGKKSQEYHNNNNAFHEGYLYGWYKGHTSDMPEHLCMDQDLWECVILATGCAVHGNWADFTTERAALDALSAGCLRYAWANPPVQHVDYEVRK